MLTYVPLLKVSILLIRWYHRACVSSCDSKTQLPRNAWSCQKPSQALVGTLHRRWIMQRMVAGMPRSRWATLLGVVCFFQRPQSVEWWRFERPDLKRWLSAILNISLGSWVFSSWLLWGLFVAVATCQTVEWSPITCWGSRKLSHLQRRGKASSWYDQIEAIGGYSYRTIYPCVLQPKQSNPDGGTHHAVNYPSMDWKPQSSISLRT